MKALALTILEKIFKDFLLYCYVKSETPQGRANFHTMAGYNLRYFGRRPLNDAASILVYKNSSP